MDRRTFIKTLASLGVAVALPANLAVAAKKEIDAAWVVASHAWDLFEVSEYRTLSYANFEEPQTRREAYWYGGPGDLTTSDIERHYPLFNHVTDRYREHLRQAAEATGEEPDSDALEAQVEEGWADWFEQASGSDRAEIDALIEEWLDEAPDWLNEWDELYKTGDAQGAAYDHFSMMSRGQRDALGIVIIEGECPGSSYFAAELHIDVEEANHIARVNDWTIRFVREGMT